MNTLKHAVFATVAATALFVSGSAVVPGTAEAHCGGHQYSCGGPSYQLQPFTCYCDGGTEWCWWAEHAFFCTRPVPGSGPDGPCASDCGGGGDSCCGGGCSTGGGYWDVWGNC